MNRPVGHNPWFGPVEPTGDQTPNPEHDDEDQKALRAFGRLLDEIMFDNDIGGVLLLSSKKSISWMISLPKWSGLTNEGIGLRLRTKMGTPIGAENANATIGFVANVRDLSFEIHGFFAKFYQDIDRRLKSKGSGIDHPKAGTPGRRGPHSAAKAKQAEARDAALTFDPKTCVSAAELRSIGVELDPAIPDPAWIQRDSVLRVGERVDSTMKLQIWEPFRWVEETINRDEGDPPLLNVRIPAEVMDATKSKEAPDASSSS